MCTAESSFTSVARLAGTDGLVVDHSTVGVGAAHVRLTAGIHALVAHARLRGGTIGAVDTLERCAAGARVAGGLWRAGAYGSVCNSGTLCAPAARPSRLTRVLTAASLAGSRWWAIGIAPAFARPTAALSDGVADGTSWADTGERAERVAAFGRAVARAGAAFVDVDAETVGALLKAGVAEADSLVILDLAVAAAARANEVARVDAAEVVTEPVGRAVGVLAALGPEAAHGAVGRVALKAGRTAAHRLVVDHAALGAGAAAGV